MSCPNAILFSPALHHSAVGVHQVRLSFARKSVHLSMSYSDVRVQPRFLRRMTNFWLLISIVSDSAKLPHDVTARTPHAAVRHASIRATTATAKWIKHARGLERKLIRIVPGSATMSMSALSPNVILAGISFLASRTAP